jgi:sec-independent protein translocase protein TatA
MAGRLCFWSYWTAQRSPATLHRLKVGACAMGNMTVWHWLILLAVGLLMFGGKGKISSTMGDVADGTNSFKKGMADDASSRSLALPAPDAPRRPRSWLKSFSLIVAIVGGLMTIVMNAEDFMKVVRKFL